MAIVAYYSRITRGDLCYGDDFFDVPFHLCVQVAATLPFNLLCAIIHCLILHGMAGTRHGVVPEVQLTALACMVSLIAVQVSSE